MTIVYIVLLFLLVFIGLIFTLAGFLTAIKNQKNRVVLYFGSAYFLASVFAFIKLAVEAIIAIR